MRQLTRPAPLDTEPLLHRKRPPPPPLFLPSLIPIDRPAKFTERLLVPLVTTFLALQFLIPAPLVISGLGAAGRPSAVVALGFALTWVAGWLRKDGLPVGRQPVRWIVAAFFLTSLLAYAVGFARGLPEVEAKSSNRQLLFLVAMCGLALAIADGVRDRRTLDVILRRLTWFTAVMAAFGVFQAVTKINPTVYLGLPGLQQNAGLIGIGQRGDEGFARVAGTATHYIEFGVLLAMVLPIAIHYAVLSTTGPERLRRWALVVLIIGAIPLSISRAAIVTLAVSLTILAMLWTWRTRLLGVFSLFAVSGAIYVLRPGLLGTIRALFKNAESDPSIQHRTDDYPIAATYFSERPWLGRGLTTFIPKEYILLDNEFIRTTLDAGIVGLLGLISLFVGGYFVGRSIRHHGVDDPSKQLGVALSASFIGAMVGSATFDSGVYPTFMGVLFLGLGAVGALYRLSRATATQASTAPMMPRIISAPLRVKWEQFLDDLDRRNIWPLN